VRACAWLALARLQPSSQEPPASTQRVQTDDCHWLRFEAWGILLTEKSDTPGGAGREGGCGADKGEGERQRKAALPRPLDFHKNQGRRQGFRAKSHLLFFFADAGKPGVCSSRPLDPRACTGCTLNQLCNAAPTLWAGQLLGIIFVLFFFFFEGLWGTLGGGAEASNPAPTWPAFVCSRARGQSRARPCRLVARV
jgi:hypothetical protein